MIEARIAGAAAVIAFGLAALGGTVVALAAPANAAPSTSSPSGPHSEEPDHNHWHPISKVGPTATSPSDSAGTDGIVIDQSWGEWHR